MLNDLTSIELAQSSLLIGSDDWGTVATFGTNQKGKSPPFRDGSATPEKNQKGACNQGKKKEVKNYCLKNLMLSIFSLMLHLLVQK